MVHIIIENSLVKKFNVSKKILSLTEANGSMLNTDPKIKPIIIIIVLFSYLVSSHLITLEKAKIPKTAPSIKYNI